MIDRRLQLLLAVDENGTVTAAAEALHRSPSGVSKQLKELAAELDIDLFERQGRKVRLTPAGERLVEHGRALNAQWESAFSDIAAAASQLCGPVVVGSFPTALPAVVAPALAAVRAEHPQLRPMMKELYSGQILAALESGAIDVGLFVADEATSRVDDHRVEVRGLMDDPIDLLVPRDHPFARRAAVPLVEARREEWITGRPDQDSYQELSAATRAVGYAPRSAHVAQELTAVAGLVAAGFGIAAVPRIATTVTHSAVVQRPLAGPHVPHRRILLAVRAGSADNPRVAATLEALRGAARRAAEESGND